MRSAGRWRLDMRYAEPNGRAVIDALFHAPLGAERLS
jgi:hypothetical protein